MKIKNAIFIVFILLIELGVFGPFFSQTFISVLISAVLFLALFNDMVSALIMAFILGFVVDIASLNSFFLTTIFLVGEVFIINLVRRKLMDFSNFAAIFIFVAIFGILRFVVDSTFLYGFVNPVKTLYIILANIIFALIAALAIWRYNVLMKANETK